MLSPEVSIVWSAPAGCPDEASVRASVASLIHDSPATSGANPPSFVGTVVQRGESFELTIDVKSTLGIEKKTIHGESCATLADAFALVAAFALDPNLARSESPASPPAEPAPSAPLSASYEASSRDRAAFEPGSPMTRWAVGLTAAGAAGTLPFPAWGVGALVAVGERPRWELAGSYWPSRATTFRVSKGDALVNVSLFSAGPSVCVPFSTNAGLQFCSGAELGRMAAQSSGELTGPSDGVSWWAAISAGIAWAIPLTRAASVRVRIDLGIPFFRPDFVIDRPTLGPGDVWRPWPVFARLSLEPELRLSPTDASSLGH